MTNTSGEPRHASDADATPRTRDLRIVGYRPLLPPAILMEELPLKPAASRTVSGHREEMVNILDRRDDRLIVVVGPCSVHDTTAALEYARRLAAALPEFERDLLLVMRVYFEKPRTTVGWRGLISDPYLDGSFAVNDGLRMGRRLLIDIVELGLPVSCEFVDPISPQFFADAVSWAAIGARTTESQVHRNLASGLSMPVGFKNGTGGSVQMAIDAIRAAGAAHSFLSVTEQGLAAIVTTRSNPDCHVVLRGGRTSPNYDRESVQSTLAGLRKAALPERVIIDASHDNSRKDFRRQPVVASEIAAQVAEGERGIVGVMLESFLVEGRQDLDDPKQLVYGQSITDSCMSWETTVQVLRELAGAVQARRAASAS
ncbi:3-deoxy-7-phosphoheptulonate synthase [Chloroflexia bacterium SDU3-3]|nr:3-deoxy-7-phosphoheptulonate synthase [Chloroflexia bacterium SDU3-3]